MTEPHLLPEQFTSEWMPFRETGGVTEPIQTLINIRKVKRLQANQNDIVSRLRATWLGRLYRSHLKQHIAIRWIAQWIWRNGYPIYINHIATRISNGKAKRWRPLIALSEFTKKSGASTYKLADATLVETPQPQVFPACDQGYLASPHDRYKFPEIFVATIRNATTYGGTNLVLAGGEVVCHDLYDFHRDYTSEELHGRTLIASKSSRIRWLLHDEAPEPISVAATFVDACAPNYAHWMTEVLPRIALFCAEDRFKEVPIVVNEGLHHNIMESLLLIAGTDREIITLPIGRALVVNTLYLTSVAGYVPFERRTNNLSRHSHGMFSPKAFEEIRNKLIAPADRVTNNDWPEKIYLRRNSGSRKVTNADEIERLLISRGFVIVQPEKFSFLEQVQLFANAKVVIASSGAALANIIFCPPTTEILIFISKQPDTSYWYWQNMASASGKVVRYFLGEAVSGSSQGIHADFSISPDEVLKNI